MGSKQTTINTDDDDTLKKHTHRTLKLYRQMNVLLCNCFVSIQLEGQFCYPYVKRCALHISFLFAHRHKFLHLVTVTTESRKSYEITAFKLHITKEGIEEGWL